MSIEIFMSYVNDHYCGLHVQESIIADIRTAVIDAVRDVTKRVGEKEEGFIDPEIVPVSFEEGTKIQSPNEFDFMIVLRRLYENTGMRTTDGCQNGYKRIFIKDIGRKLEQFGINVNDDLGLFPDNIKMYYTYTLREVLEEIKKTQVVKKSGVLVLDDVEFLTLKASLNCFGSLKADDIEPTNTLASGEGDMGAFYTYHLDINIDLMPALSIHGITPIVAAEDFPGRFESLLTEWGCHLVCKTCRESSSPLCFQISFAAAEVQLMSNLHPLHLRCYKVLKFLLVEGTNINKPLKSISLSSYMLKTAFLYHEYEHKCSNPSFEGCMVDVLVHIREGFARGHFKSFFMRNLNVWGRSYRIPVMAFLESTSGLDNVCPADWGFIFWFKMWYQILNRALEIFSQIKNQHLQFSMIKDFLCHSEGGIHRDSGSQRGGYLTVCKENEMDRFLRLFGKLRDTMRIVTSDYLRHIQGPRTKAFDRDPPKKEILDKVLPKFKYYVQYIEEVCRTKIDVPVTTPDLSNLFEIIYSRER